jgi:hypothetical protein
MPLKIRLKRIFGRRSRIQWKNFAVFEISTRHKEANLIGHRRERRWQWWYISPSCSKVDECKGSPEFRCFQKCAPMTSDYDSGKKPSRIFSIRHFSVDPRPPFWFS